MLKNDTIISRQKMISNRKKKELIKSRNPFALVILIQLAALETKPDEESRLLNKLEFFRCLHKLGWSTAKSMNMYRFLDSILNLNPKFEVQYFEMAKKIDEEFQMQYIVSAERYGIEQGKQQGEAHMLTHILKAKFKELPEVYVEKIKDAKPDVLNRWAMNFVNAETLDDVFQQ